VDFIVTGPEARYKKNLRWTDERDTGQPTPSSHAFGATVLTLTTFNRFATINRMTWDFQYQLALFGPNSQRRLSPAQAARYCRWVTHTHYENFSVASWLLPRRLVRHFHAIYAYCRWSDDLSDETGPDASRLLAWWRSELHACFTGQVRHPVFVALLPTIQRFGLPLQPFADLLSAFEQDQIVRRYDHHAQLREYCRRSANPVGRLVLHLFEQHDEERGILSDHICTALQEANFWQDVARDYALGRIYLPRDEREQFGVSEATIARSEATPAFRALMRFVVQRTRATFATGAPLVQLVREEFRPDLELFLAGGLAILDAIEAADFDVLTHRPTLSAWHKGRLLLAALGRKAGRWMGLTA
jgi:squalene synthase HpnC